MTFQHRRGDGRLNGGVRGAHQTGWHRLRGGTGVHQRGICPQVFALACPPTPSAVFFFAMTRIAAGYVCEQRTRGELVSHCCPLVCLTLTSKALIPKPLPGCVFKFASVYDWEVQQVRCCAIQACTPFRLLHAPFHPLQLHATCLRGELKTPVLC
jgi:hypothetical protein